MNKKISAMDLESNMLIDLNTFITSDCKMHEYHMKHIKLVRRYALILNKKLGNPVPNRKLSFIALAHDLFKERALDITKDGTIDWNGYNIPQNTTKYVRSNLDVLEEFGLDEYFNSSIQYHPLSAGIFLYKEMNISDKEILYPVMFHSCPIIDVYETLSPQIQRLTDIIMLADKLSSNYLKINYRKKPVRIDLDQAVFGSNGKEFSYTLGLYLARLIGQGNSPEEQGVLSTKYYYDKLAITNPLISEGITIKSLGGNKTWPERKSQVLKIR